MLSDDQNFSLALLTSKSDTAIRYGVWTETE